MMNTVNESEFGCVGFWRRLGASIIDTVLVVVICFPLLTLIYGKEYWSSTQLVQGPADLLLNWVLPAVAVVLFWVYRQATPGKIAIGARIVDARTGGRPSPRPRIGRDFPHYVSKVPP